MGKNTSQRASTRRHVLAALKEIDRRISWLRGQWTVSSKFHDFEAPRENGRVVVRERTAAEYPENSHADWHQLVKQLDEAAGQIAELRRYAIAMWHVTQEEEWDRLHSDQKV